MNRPLIDRDGAIAGDAVDLAQESPFALGHVNVAPAELCVSVDGWSRRLEPRAMQVLVVLARAAPAVVGRGELNMRVWSGRVVGGDAINRTVQTLRRIASEAPGLTPFSIETIPRVGYRLELGQAADASDSVDARAPEAPDASFAIDPSTGFDPANRRDTGMRWAMAAAAVIALVAAIVAWRLAGDRASEPTTWTVTKFATFDDLPPGAEDLALSPDGGKLAYRGQDINGRERIFVRAVRDGGAGTAVSPAGLDTRRPVWSPDSADLAFSTFDGDRPCRLYVLRSGGPAAPAGRCETTRDPHLAWSADGASLLFGDAPGENAVQRITAIRLSDGRRDVFSSPPGDSLGDGLPMSRGKDIVFQRRYGWADEGWIAHDPVSGRERVLWRGRGVAGSVAAPLPDGTLVVAWTRGGASGLDFVDHDGRVISLAPAVGSITALSIAGDSLLVETDHAESALARPGDGAPLATVHGRISGAALLSDGRLRFAATSVGVSRLWERDLAGRLRPWGSFTAPRISALAPSRDGHLTAALITSAAGREIVLFDHAGKPIYRWNPHARSLNSAAWTADGLQLIVPVLDGAGWRLFALDPFKGAPPRDLGLPGFAVLFDHGSALYAVRAGESTGTRELWRLDGRARRLPIDLTLFDIVNFRAVDKGVWLPDRSDRARPRLVLRDIATGRVLRAVAAPGLAGPGTGLAADARGPVYVKLTRDDPEYGVLTLVKDREQSSNKAR